ncbi:MULTISPECIES: hypothetical protein [unclassified Streptomyces]|uniref:hypothetical protein n=1 Tax=unclassified Streptomyces TaxID=2593676 RepID=UPI002DDBA791|nr:hypothetical protein [Streptomyces sp. NBC_01775]WSB78615.1 hypothetical protein OHB04_24525 [Streptomyces sp. NBC_01775]WSS41964.1 hypothetical protein OG220_16240 [Streptomyces sp. NBC_01187]
MRPTRRVLTALLGTVAATGLALAGTPAQAVPVNTSSHPVSAASTAGSGHRILAKLTHAQSTAKFRSAGITWTSSGGCSDRNNPSCTSFDQLNSATADGAVTLKSASGCAIRLTGGTETGHASGTYSHWNGYKLDMSLSSCLDNYITGTFTSIGGSKWKSASGNVYYREGNHWDVTYYNCGGC